MEAAFPTDAALHWRFVLSPQQSCHGISALPGQFLCAGSLGSSFMSLSVRSEHCPCIDVHVLPMATLSKPLILSQRRQLNSR